MPKKTFRVETILGGISPTLMGPQPSGTYEMGLGIDPDLKSRVATANPKTGGIISPVGMTKFSSTGLSGFPMWISTTPKDALVYVYASDGELISYSALLTSASETVIGTPTNGAGQGMAVYNNYIYLATTTDVSRYGPLNNSPALTNNVWTGATLGSQTALSNTTMPTVKQKPLPNHAMHVHTDGFLYFCDVISTAYATTAKEGKGVIHRISTSKTTDEGDTNNGSAYDVLELPFGYIPVAIQSYGTDLAILAIPQIDATVITLSRGRSQLFLWDTFASIPYKQIPIPDPLASAMINNNGRLYVFSGNTSNGVRVSEYAGGETMRQVTFLEEGVTPFQGAVDAWEDRIIWGGQVTFPTSAGCVFAYGSKNSDLPAALHNIIKVSGSPVTPIVTSLKYVLQADNIIPNPIVGWGGDGSNFGIDKWSASATLSCQWRQRFEVGKPFSIIQIRVELDNAVDSTTSITPSVIIDDGNKTGGSLTAIANSNFPSNQTILYKRPELTYVGQDSFSLNFEWANTTPRSIVSIEVDVDVFDVYKTA